MRGGGGMGTGLGVMGGAEILGTEKCAFTSKPVSLSVFLVEEKEKGFFSSKNKIETERTEREKVMATRPLPFFCRDVLFSSTTTCDKQRQKKREEEEEETEREKEKLFLVGRGEGMKLFFCFDGREKQKKKMLLNSRSRASSSLLRK